MSNKESFLLAMGFCILLAVGLIWWLSARMGFDPSIALMSLFGAVVSFYDDDTGKQVWYSKGRIIKRLTDLLPLADRISFENKAIRPTKQREPIWIASAGNVTPDYTYSPEHVALAMYRQTKKMGSWSIADRAALRLVLDRMVYLCNSRFYNRPGSMGGFSMFADSTENCSYHNSKPWPVRAWVGSGSHFSLHLSNGQRIRLPWLAEEVTTAYFSEIYG